MVDMLSEGVVDLKISVLNVLRLLPITNKTILKDSNILQLVERLSQDIDESQRERLSQDIDESQREHLSQDIDEDTIKTDPGEAEASESGSSTTATMTTAPDTTQKTAISYEGLPHKKRKLFQQQEEASSSDGDTASESGKKVPYVTL